VTETAGPPNEFDQTNPCRAVVSAAGTAVVRARRDPGDSGGATAAGPPAGAGRYPLRQVDKLRKWSRTSQRAWRS